MVGALKELDLCQQDADCSAPLLCKADAKGFQKVCTRACVTTGDCGGGRRCEQVDGTKVCVYGDVGRDCKAADECNFACLLGQGYCTSTCNSGADCPAGFGCQEGVGNPPQKICAMTGEPCTPSDPKSRCIAPLACDTTSPSLQIAGCTLTCNSAADCPQRPAGLPGWTCPQGTCQRPADVYGPASGGTYSASYLCVNGQPVNLCNDGQHINFDAFSTPNPPAGVCSTTEIVDGVAGDSCLDTCLYHGGCRFGFVCNALAGLSATVRMGLCLPAGTGAIKSPCSSNTQCEFGYCTKEGFCSRDCTDDGLCPGGATCKAPGDGTTAEGKTFKRCE